MRRVLAVFMAVMATMSAAVIPQSQASGSQLTAPSTSALASSLRCSELGNSELRPVLLIPGTALSAQTNYDWNYARAFRARNTPFCTVEIPHRGMGDVQMAAEYVAYAVRLMHRATEKRISVVGYSQGGMVIRWVLKYWPGTRSMVDDVVGIAPPHHGTLTSALACLAGCAPAAWQQRTGSAFLRALNTGPETWPRISYTQVYTLMDEVVVPDFGPSASSRLNTGAGKISNIPVQRICPAHVADHLTIGTTDPVAFAVVWDAISHLGPARTVRISRRVCAQAVMPHVEMKRLVANQLRVTTEAVTSIATYPHVSREPALRRYAR